MREKQKPNLPPGPARRNASIALGFVELGKLPRIFLQGGSVEENLYRLYWVVRKHGGRSIRCTWKRSKPAAGRPCTTHPPSHSGLRAPACKAPGTHSHKMDPTPNRQEAARRLHPAAVVVSEGTNRGHVGDTPTNERRGLASHRSRTRPVNLLFCRHSAHLPVDHIGNKPVALRFAHRPARQNPPSMDAGLLRQHSP